MLACLAASIAATPLREAKPKGLGSLEPRLKRSVMLALGRGGGGFNLTEIEIPPGEGESKNSG